MISENEVAAVAASEVLVDADDPQYEDCIIDHEDDIDWEEIIATTEKDYEAGRYAFNSEDYATHEEAMVHIAGIVPFIWPVTWLGTATA